jgi:hypothetical protein
MMSLEEPFIQLDDIALTILCLRGRTILPAHRRTPAMNEARYLQRFWNQPTSEAHKMQS